MQKSGKFGMELIVIHTPYVDILDRLTRNRLEGI